MKTKVELTDVLVKELEDLATREHRALREGLEDVVNAGLQVRRRSLMVEPADRAAAMVWLARWHELGRRIDASSTDFRSTVQILMDDRR